MSNMILYAITNWDQHFENNRTREMKSMAWVPVPNKMDGDGYTELLDHPDGPLHYAAWMACVLIASRCGERGTLLRSTSEPHDSASLSRMSRIPAAVFEAALPRLLKLGWLSRKSFPSKESQVGAEIPQEGASIPQATDYGTERNGTEINTPLSPPKGARAKSSRSKTGHVKNNPPSLEEVDAYCRERGNDIVAQEFLDHYTANGWVQGKGQKPLVDWKAAVRTWETERKKRSVGRDPPKQILPPVEEQILTWNPYGPPPP